MVSGGRRRSPQALRVALGGLVHAVPDTPAHLVDRPRLTTLLDVAARQRLTVVVAPPGYGKTVLLSHWARSQRRPPVRWLTLEPHHDDPLTLLEHLSTAVSGLHPGPARAGSRRSRRPLQPRVRARLLSTLLSRLGRLPPTTLVLDDFHHLSDPIALDLLAELFDHAPRSLHVIAASRVDPPLPFFRMHDPGVLFQLRQEDLAFTVDEAVALVRRVAGIELTNAQAAALVERTEGWVAGLQLAALALPDQPDVERFVELFAGDDRAVADYLTERVLTNLPEHLRGFLSTTCHLDRMSAPLCDLVTCRDDSRSVLDELERRSLFISAVDSDRVWFRYHRLFRSYLRSHLRDSCPTSEATVLRTAAEWHRDHGDLDTAVDYLIRSGSWSQVLDVVDAAGTAMVQHGRASTVAAWLDSVTSAHRPPGNALDLAEAAALLAGGELHRARPLLDELAARHGTSRADRAGIHLLRAWGALRTGELNAAVADARLASSEAGSLGDDDAIPSLFGLVRDAAELGGAADVVQGAALVHLGRFAEARPLLCVDDDAIHARWQLLSLGARALLEAWSEQLELAEHLSHRARRLGEQVELAHDPACVQAAVAAAAVARNRGELDLARAELDAASAALLCEDERLTAADLLNERALLALAEGDAGACLTVLADQSVTATRAVATAGRRPAIEADVYLTLGDLERAARALARTPDDAPDVAGARVRLELARGDLPAARRVVAGWPEAPAGDHTVGHLLAMAVVEHLDGQEARAERHLDEVVRRAELEGNVGMFRWPEARTYVRSRYRSAPTTFLRAVVEQPMATPKATAVAQLVEQLTEREHLVLQLLPTRLTNAEIAQSLGISLNTVKTHLKHVYRKLEVEHRSEAIAAAERFGLL